MERKMPVRAETPGSANSASPGVRPVAASVVGGCDCCRSIHRWSRALADDGLAASLGDCDQLFASDTVTRSYATLLIRICTNREHDHASAGPWETSRAHGGPLPLDPQLLARVGRPLGDGVEQ